MIIVECDQGNLVWHQARAGLITASMFETIQKKVNGLTDQQRKYVDALLAGKTELAAKAIAGYKSQPKMTDKVATALEGKPVGEYSDATKDYAFRLAVERISGEPLDEGFQTWAMKRGNELEPDARACHEIMINTLVTKAGFIMTDDEVFGASADGIIGDDGGSEYKCLIDPSRLRTILIEKDIDQFKAQVQGCLWITGRKWWHFGLYCPALKSIGKEFTLVEVKRDENYIEELELNLIAFNTYVEDYKLKIINS